VSIASDFTMYWIDEVQYAVGCGEIAMACMVQEEYTNGDNIK
jgi:hypothetical protein